MQSGLNLLMGILLVSSTGLMAKELHNSYSLSLVGMSMDYKEYSPQLIDSETSGFTDIGGFEMAYGYMLTNDSKINASVMYLAGDTDYVGSALGSGQPYGSETSTTANYIIDTELNYIRYTELNYGLTLNYGAGLGYRYWERQLSQSQIEGYKWFSIRPLIGLEISPSKTVSFGIEVEYQYAINPIMSISQNIDNQANSVNLGGVNTWKITVPISYSYGNNITFFTKYIYEHQNIKQSNSIDYILRDQNNNSYQAQVLEPDSTASNQYLEIGMTFKF